MNTVPGYLSCGSTYSLSAGPHNPNLGKHDRPCVCQSRPAIAPMNLDQPSLEGTSLAEFILEKVFRYLADLFVKM